MPAKKIDKYAATTWASDTEDLTCPSGQICLVRRIDIMQLIADGTLDKTDMITAMVDQKHVSKKAKGGANSRKSQEMTTEMALRQALKDPAKMQELVDTVNSVTRATVIQPELHDIVPIDEREPGKVYVDMVDLNDRMFILNWAFSGTRDVARFRRELQQSVDGLADVESLESPAQ